MFSSPEKRTVILCLLLVVVTLVLYNSVTAHPFTNFDDDRYITNNRQVRAGLTWDTIRWAFTTNAVANWHPLSWISHALDCQLFHLNPAGHHYVSVLLHAINAILLFLVLQAATRCSWRSLMVAALFAVHPVNVESVAWIAERKNVLSMCFLLLALFAYGRYAKEPHPRRYLLVVFFFACGLMAKPMVITLPLLLLLWDYWPLRRLSLGTDEGATTAAAPRLSRLMLEKVPLFALSAASAAATMKMQSAGGAMTLGQNFTLDTRLGNALVSYLRYLGKAFWPTQLSPMYPHPGNTLEIWQVCVAALVIAAITIAVLVARERRYFLTGWFWFVGTLVPMIGLIQVGGQAMADRYAYLPFVGLFILICWALPDFTAARGLPASWLKITSAAAILVLALTASHQLGFWKSNVTLWAHAIAVTPPNFIAQDNLGGALVNDGRIEEAMPHFEAAVRIYPDDPLAWLNIGTHSQQKGDIQQGLRQYQKVLQMTSDPGLRVKAYENMGIAYRDLHDYPSAKQSYESALNLDSNNDVAWLGLGLVALKSGDTTGAVPALRRAMEIKPTDVGFILLNRALAEQGQTSEAQAAFQEAQKISPDWESARKTADSLLNN